MNMFTQLSEGLDNDAEVKHDVPMKNYTTLRVGGNADFFIVPNSIDKIVTCVRVCEALNLSVYIIGHGSNLIVADRGIRGAVIHIGRHCNKAAVNGNIITAEAGAYIPTLVSIAMKYKLKGIEIVTGIPGNLGGSIYMNAGYTKPISGIIKSVTVLRDFNVVKLNRDEMSFGHRKSPFQYNDDIILSAELQLEPGDIKKVVHEYILNRKIKQPLHCPNCGSVFKKPGRLVYELKGISSGGAKYEKGFILNTGEATAKDIVDVIEIVRSRVKRRLVLEAELMGDF